MSDYYRIERMREASSAEQIDGNNSELQNFVCRRELTIRLVDQPYLKTVFAYVSSSSHNGGGAHGAAFPVPDASTEC